MSHYNEDEYRLWNKAKELFMVQRAEILSWYPEGTPPVGWHEIGLDARLMWWDRAAALMQTPSEQPTRPDLPKRVPTLIGLHETH